MDDGDRSASDGPRADASLEDLVVEYLDRSEAEGPAALDAICAREPERADALRSRVASLGRMGLLADARAERAPRRLGEFAMLGRIGGGGMGFVYKAVQESLGRVVALKVLRPEQVWFDGARDRFRREAEAVARLAHPTIVPLFAFGEENGVPYLAMEFVDGVALSTVLESWKGRDPAGIHGRDLAAALHPARVGGGLVADPLGLFGASWPDAVARIGVALAGALAHAHERGVLHRDLKPGNVMLARDGRVPLVDFGLAAREGAARLTRTGSQLGSLPYMAPEQVDGRVEDVDERTDVYGLGVTLYELLATRLPYEGTSTHDVARRVSAGDAPRLRTRNPRVSRDVETVVAKAMDPRPERRYTTAADLGRDLANVVARRPVEARRAGPLARASRWSARHPAGAVALALGVVVVVGGPIGWAVQQQRALDAVLAEAARTRDALVRAEANFAHALDAVAPLTRVGQDGLAGMPAAEEAQRQILEGALAFHGRLAEERRDDPALATERARAELRVGEILAALGRHAEAEVVFASVEQAAAARPSVTGGVDETFLPERARLARSRSLVSLGRRAEARESLEALLADIDRLVIPDGPVPVRETAVEAWSMLQELRRGSGDRAGSIAAHEARGRVLNALLKEHLGVPRYGVELAECVLALLVEQTGYLVTGPRDEGVRENSTNLLEFVDSALAALRAQDGAGDAARELLGRALQVRAQALSYLERYDESLAAWNEVVATRRELVERHPGVPRHKRELSTSLSTLGAVRGARREWSESLVVIDEAVRIREGLVALAPEDTKQRAGLGIMRMNGALNRLRLDRREEFLAESERAVADMRAHLAVEPGDPFLQQRLANAHLVRTGTFLELGRAADARREAERLERPAPPEGLNHARLWAGIAAGSSGADAESAREHAFDLIATAAGGPAARKLLDHPYFDALRSDPRFAAAAERLVR